MQGKSPGGWWSLALCGVGLCRWLHVDSASGYADLFSLEENLEGQYVNPCCCAWVSVSPRTSGLSS